MVLNVFCEGSHAPNPVARVLGITVLAEDGAPLVLKVQATLKLF